MVTRLMTIHRICEEFHCLPSAAQMELENDPEHLALELLPVRGYIAAKQAFDSARNKVDDLVAWEGNPMMTLVETHTFEFRQAQLERQERERLAAKADE